MFNVDPLLLDSFIRILSPAIVVLGSLIVISSYIVIRVPANYYLKWVIVPAFMLTSIFGSMFLTENFGYAAPYYLPAHFQFLGYKVENSGYKKTTIEVWINDKSKTRLYVIPYSREAEEAFKQAQNLLNSNEGAIVDMDSPGSESNENGNGSKNGHGRGSSENHGKSSQYQSHLRLPPPMPEKGHSEFPQFDPHPSINNF